MIHRLRIQHFKSIVDVDMDLSAVTVLVGKSGTGKSSFVQALRFLRDVLAPKPGVEHSWPYLRPIVAPDAPTSFDVEFSVAGIDERFRYELSMHPDGPGRPPENERLTLGEKCLFHQGKAAGQRVSSWLVEPDLIQVPPAGPIALRGIPSVSEIVIAYTALTAGIGCYIFSDDVLSQATRKDQPTDGLADDAGNFLRVVKDIVSNLQDLGVRKSIVSALQRLNPSIASVELDNIQQPTRVVVGHRFGGKVVALDLSQESDGFRRFYAHLLAIYQRPPKQTLIFEHPEDGIHPGALALLAEEFQAASETGRGQVILTTHSPRLLDQFKVDQIRVVELDGPATRIGKVSAEQVEAIREGLLEPGELLTVDPARLQMEAAGA